MITLEDYIRNNIDIKYRIDKNINDIYFDECYLRLLNESEYYRQLSSDYTTVGLNIDIHNTSLNSLYNIIAENLKSHDVTKLIKDIDFLYKGFDYNIFSDKNNITSLQIKYDNIELLKKFYKDDDIKQILNFYNYYITTNYYKISEERPVIYIEPTFPAICNDIVYNNIHNGILFHFCNEESVQKILKTGLRCKSQS